MKKYFWFLVFILATAVVINSCTGFGTSVLEASVYQPISTSDTVEISKISIKDAVSIGIDTAFLTQVLRAKLQALGLSIAESSNLKVELQVYEKVIQSSLKGDRSLTGILSFYDGTALTARIFYTSEQPRGTNSDSLLFAIVEKMIGELSDKLKKHVSKDGE